MSPKQTKPCSKCKLHKSLDNYHKEKRSKDGLSYYCKDCAKINRHNNYISNKEKNNRQSKQYYLDNIEDIQSWRKEFKRSLNGRFYNGRDAAKRRNYEWALTLEEYSELISHPCYYCNNVLGPKVETGSGLDRMDNSKGYIPGNCTSCCDFCNSLKSNLLTAEETLVAVQAIIKFREL